MSQNPHIKFMPHSTNHVMKKLPPASPEHCSPTRRNIHVCMCAYVCAHIHIVVVQSLSRVRLSVTSMDCSSPGFPVPRHLPEFAQTHVHWVDGAIQPSHPLSPATVSLAQHHIHGCNLLQSSKLNNNLVILIWYKLKSAREKGTWGTV